MIALLAPLNFENNLLNIFQELIAVKFPSRIIGAS
jgi:hypothetical protein